MAHNAYDKGARYTARLDPPAFLGWVLKLPLTAFAFDGWLDTRSVTLPQGVEHIGDTVAGLRDLTRHELPWAVALEFQLTPDPALYGRMTVYLGTLWLQQRPSPERGDRYDIGGVVINLTKTGTTSRRSVWPEAGLETRIQMVERNLADESAADLLHEIGSGTVGRCVLPFIPLMHGGGESGSIKQWKRLAKADPDSRKRSDYGALALVFSEATEHESAWKQALKGWNVMQSKQVLEWQAEAREEGLAEGRSRTIVQFLTTRFGAVPTQLRNKLLAVRDSELLDNYTTLAAQVPDLKEFRRLTKL